MSDIPEDIRATAGTLLKGVLCIEPECRWADGCRCFLAIAEALMAERAQSVFVGYRGNNFDGFSAPLCVFVSRELASIWLTESAASDDAYTASAKVIELPVIRSPDKAENRS